MPLGREESVYSLPGQNMSQLPLFWGPDLLGYRDGGVHGLSNNLSSPLPSLTWPSCARGRAGVSPTPSRSALLSG